MISFALTNFGIDEASAGMKSWVTIEIITDKTYKENRFWKKK